MIDYLRLTQVQKEALIKVHQTYKGQTLQEKINDAASRFEDLPNSGEYIFISKPEVTDELWDALVKAGIGQVRKFENGDTDPDYRKGLEVERNLMEAIFECLEMFIRAIVQGVPGMGQGTAEGRTPGKARRPRRDDAGDALEG